jgi:metallophosphoesterase (TIGR00282 family)
LKILIIGDIVGRPGRNMVKEHLSRLKQKYNASFVIANGENAAGGNGITEKNVQELFMGGVDFLTLGNHTWDNKDIFNFIDSEERIIRPANYPEGTPGRGYQVVQWERGINIGILNLSGRTYMNPLDCPFKTAEKLIPIMRNEARIIIVDFHAEATSEKMSMGYFLDGKVSVVVGTHTHIQTADERILPQGTAYITDLGMTGPYDSILGVEKEAVIRKFVTQLPTRFQVAKGPGMINGVFVEIDEKTGKSLRIERINFVDN